MVQVKQYELKTYLMKILMQIQDIMLIESSSIMEIVVEEKLNDGVSIKNANKLGNKILGKN